MVLKKLETTKDGLSSKEARIRLQNYGPNELASPKKISLLSRFFAQFIGLFDGIFIQKQLLRIKSGVPTRRSYTAICYLQKYSSYHTRKV